VKKTDFDFDLPPELIAQAPLAERSASRLLVLDVEAQARQDRMFRDLPEYLREGDLLIFNDTRVLPARLYGRKDTGGQVEILIERVTGTHEATVQLGVSKKPKEGGRIELADGSHAVVLGRDGPFSGCASNRTIRWSACYCGWVKCPCRRTSSVMQTPVTWSATRPCSRASRVRLPRLPPACISTKPRWRFCASGASSSAM
jgi:hypothetical protein